MGQAGPLTHNSPHPAGRLSTAAGRAILFYCLSPTSGKFDILFGGVPGMPPISAWGGEPVIVRMQSPLMPTDEGGMQP